MASIQVRKETGTLIIDFYYKGDRCREQTALADTPANRKRLQKVIDRITSEISAGTFDYGTTFPGSKMIARFEQSTEVPPVVMLPVANTVQPDGGQTNVPLFKDFAETWFTEKEVEWRKSHRKFTRADLDNLLIPEFGDKVVSQITKADILGYRAKLAKVLARGKSTP
ncbi:MAG: DUF3596 domain-containing protein, partial [Gallionella sp.]